MTFPDVSSRQNCLIMYCRLVIHSDLLSKIVITPPLLYQKCNTKKIILNSALFLIYIIYLIGTRLLLTQLIPCVTAMAISLSQVAVLITFNLTHFLDLQNSAYYHRAYCQHCCMFSQAFVMLSLCSF